jgi:hypothetical protein
LSQAAHFRGDDRETAPLITRPRRLDCRVQRQQVRLECNRVDDADDVGDPTRGAVDLGHGADDFRDYVAAASRHVHRGLDQCDGLPRLFFRVAQSMRQLLDCIGGLNQRGTLRLRSRSQLAAAGGHVVRRASDRICACGDGGDHAAQSFHQTAQRASSSAVDRGLTRRQVHLVLSRGHRRDHAAQLGRLNAFGTQHDREIGEHDGFDDDVRGMREYDAQARLGEAQHAVAELLKIIERKMMHRCDESAEHDRPPVAVTQQECQAHEDAEVQLDHAVRLMDVQCAENHQHGCDRHAGRERARPGVRHERWDDCRRDCDAERSRPRVVPGRQRERQDRQAPQDA